MDFATWTADALSPNVQLPEMKTSGVGVFGWTDRKDRLHLLGYPRDE